MTTINSTELMTNWLQGTEAEPFDNARYLAGARPLSACTLLTSTVWRRMRSYLEARLIGEKPKQPTAKKLVRRGIAPKIRDDFQGITMSDDDVKKELERLRNENAALKKGAATGITMKVSEKGGLSVYGMGRFPITLYKEQWLKLLDMSDAIRAFIAANEATLKVKG